MEYTDTQLDEWIDLMRIIALIHHDGQYRRDNATPYMVHVEGVTSKVEKRLKPIALGHDLVEDTTITITDLIAFGFPNYITDAIELLTHLKEDSDEVYWNKILTSAAASKVKVADINYNNNDFPSERQKNKYKKALELFANKGYSL